MRKTVSVILFAAGLLTAGVASAQSRDYEPGPVWRAVYYRIIPGQEAIFWKDLREHAKPMMELAKQDGIQIDYKVFTNPYKEKPEDWDVLLMLGYPNFAALDTLEAKADGLYLKHFGSSEKVAEAVKRRNASREVLAVRIVREAILGGQ